MNSTGTDPIASIDWATLFGSTITDIINGVESLIPVAVPVFGLMVTIGLGIKLIKRFTGKG